MTFLLAIVVFIFGAAFGYTIVMMSMMKGVRQFVQKIRRKE